MSDADGVDLMDHLPDLRATHYDRQFEDGHIELAKQLYAACRAVYPGPDALGVGLGWCCVSGSIAHQNHKDQYGRVWETPGYTVRHASVTINGRCPACGSSEPHTRHHRDRKGKPVPVQP